MYSYYNLIVKVNTDFDFDVNFNLLLTSGYKLKKR